MWETLLVAGILILAVALGGVWIFREVRGGGCASCSASRSCGLPPELADACTSRQGEDEPSSIRPSDPRDPAPPPA